MLVVEMVTECVSKAVCCTKLIMVFRVTRLFTCRHFRAWDYYVTAFDTDGREIPIPCKTSDRKDVMQGLMGQRNAEGWVHTLRPVRDKSSLGKGKDVCSDFQPL